MTPLFQAPPTLTDPASGTLAWFFDERCTMVDQTVGNMTHEVSAFLTGPVEAEVQRRYVKAGKKVSFVHDWRSCVTYEAKAREQLIEWGRASRGHVDRISVQLSRDASPFIRIAASTGISLLRVIKMKIELVHDLEPIIRELSR
jgi:hypothetical protein